MDLLANIRDGQTQLARVLSFMELQSKFTRKEEYFTMLEEQLTLRCTVKMARNLKLAITIKGSFYLIKFCGISKHLLW